MGRVIKRDVNGFVTKSEVQIRADPVCVYDAFGEVAKWWDPNHTFGGNADNLSIELRPGGHFFESLGANDGVIHSTVVFAQRGSLLRFTGALGPLQGLGAQGTLTAHFEGRDENTVLSTTYVVLGRDLQDWAAPVEQVLNEQLVRLKSFLEDKGSAR